MKIEMHLIQNFAPSCLNRDDSNSPKDCDFGGVRRARISSQCIKRAIREYFKANGLQEMGKRTKRLKSQLVSSLTGLEPSDLVPYAIDLFIDAYYSALDDKRPDETKVLLYLSTAEVEAGADAIRKMWPELQSIALELKDARAKISQDNVSPATPEGTEQPQSAKKAKGKSDKPKMPTLGVDKKIAESLKAPLSADIALFGRMLAEQTGKNVDAACQVAHALSTHRVDIDFDFFSAVDDLNTKEQTGAGMLGITGFNSPCFYRYALIDEEQLAANLGGSLSTIDVIRDFLTASVHAIPNAKQNSMSAQNLPSFGMFVLRSSGSPCSLANAFVKPVNVAGDSDPDLVGSSVGKMSKHWADLTRVYGDDGIECISVFSLDEELPGSFGQSVKGSVKEAIAAIVQGLEAGEKG